MPLRQTYQAAVAPAAPCRHAERNLVGVSGQAKQHVVARGFWCRQETAGAVEPELAVRSADPVRGRGADAAHPR